jgi:hypothetical protein
MLVGVMAAALLAANAALAVTDGELDGDGHPHVGILVFDEEGEPTWRCSGTLVTPTIMLTAGHCTFGASGGRVWFDSTEAEILAGGYPDAGGTGIEFVSWATHPEYIDALFFLHDVGIVVLSEPVDPGVFGVLPRQDQLDRLARMRGNQDQMFTSVGYGLQRINPVFVESERTRMVANPHLIQINVPGFTGDFSLMLSNNHATGGTCFGDSGGPNFLGDSNVVAGVTSFGNNGNCAGTGGVFRMDRANVLDWLASQGVPVP